MEIQVFLFLCDTSSWQIKDDLGCGFFNKRLFKFILAETTNLELSIVGMLITRT
jgi:hypothetical protein